MQCICKASDKGKEGERGKREGGGWFVYELEGCTIWEGLEGVVRASTFVLVSEIGILFIPLKNVLFRVACCYSSSSCMALGRLRTRVPACSLFLRRSPGKWISDFGVERRSTWVFRKRGGEV